MYVFYIPFLIFKSGDDWRGLNTRRIVSIIVFFGLLLRTPGPVLGRAGDRGSVVGGSRVSG
jgi:hypothetical protein